MFQEIFGEDLKKVKKNKKDFIKIEPLESFKSFKIMENFANLIPDNHLKIKFQDILLQKKPFQNFKNIVENSNFKKDWFDFRKGELEKIVENLLTEE